MPSIIVAAIGLTGVAASIATGLIGFAISYVANSLFAPDAPETPPDQGVGARIPTDPKNKLPVVYGEQRVAGQTVFADISADNQTMYFIIALCEGPIEAITAVTWGDKLLTFKDDEDISTGLREVSKAKSSNPNDETDQNFLNGKFRCRVSLTGIRSAEMEAKSSRWNTNSANRTFPNTVYAYVELDYDRENRITGLPNRLYFTVKGRTVKTLSGTTLSTSTTMSTNPVDNLIDYMTNSRYGCGLKETDLDLVSFNKHKDFCNVGISANENTCTLPANSFTTQNGSTVATTTGYNTQVDCGELAYFVGATAGSRTATTGGVWTSSALSTDPERYTTNGVLNTNNELDRNLSDLTVGNGGVLTYNLGTFGLISQGEQDVVQRDGVDVSFSEDNIIGKLDITGSGFDAVLNEVTAKFTSKRQLYQQEQAVVSFDSVSETDTNTIQNPNEPRLEKTIQFPFTNNVVEARRLARVIVNDSRQALIVSFQANIDNTDLQAGDIIEISHNTPGWGPGLIGNGGRFSDNTACTNAGGTVSGTTCVIAPKQFRVQQVDERIIDQDNSSIGVSIIAREYAAGVFNSETLLLEDPAPNTNLPNPLVVPDLGLTATDTDAIAVGEPASMVINGVPTSQIQVSWTNSTYLDTVEVRYIRGSLSDDDSDWTVTTFDGEQASGILTNLNPESDYQIQARPRNTLGVLGVFGPIGSGKVTVRTVPLSAIFEVEVNLISNNGSVFKNNAGEKELTVTVTKVTEIDADLADPDTFNYLWKQDGSTICIDSNKNVAGIADQSLTLGATGINKQACNSAGGFWGGDVGDTRDNTTCFATGDFNSTTVFDTQSDAVLGCNVAGSNRADTVLTGYIFGSTNLDGAITAADDITTVTVNNTADFAETGSILINTTDAVETFTYTSKTSTTFVGSPQELLDHEDDISVTEGKIRTITVDHEDVTESSGFSCEVSNIELTTT